MPTPNQTRQLDVYNQIAQAPQRTDSKIAVYKRMKETHVLVSYRINQLWLASRQLRMSLEHLNRLVDLALLEAQLGKRRNCSLTFGVDAKGFIATPFGGGDVLFPLIECETFVDEGENIWW